MSSDKPSPLIFLTGEIDGDRDSTSDFAFVRIGASVPVKLSNSSFDLQKPPSQPLGISQRHRLLFVSHPQGFFVAKTGDVLEVAKEIKEKGKKVKAVEDVSVVDVKIGRVSTLAVSGDELTLAAVVDGEIFFFSVLSLLNKGQEPSFSCSLGDPGTVKDFKWQKNMEKSFVVLSTRGLLYHGILETELKKIMDNVDAVDWSAEGGFVAVATEHTIIILSSNFKEVLRISVVLESWKPSTDSGSTMRVDSIKWLRDDSIIVGCFQVSEVGDEEGYFVQVIKTKKHNFFEVSCDPAVYSFPDLFDGIWNILPIGCGPYLLASYLDYWEVALVSNQKAIDQHISLLKWSTKDNKGDVVALEFRSDKYTPKIEVPENDDDNLVLGFCFEKFSSDEKIKIQVDEAFKELSLCYALFCLTSEGTLNLFHAARISEPSDWSLLSQSLDYNDVVKEKQSMASSFEGSIPKLRLKDTAEDATFENLSQQKNTEVLNSHKDTFELQSETVSSLKRREGHGSQVGHFTGQVGRVNKSSVVTPTVQGSGFALKHEVKPGMHMFSVGAEGNTSSISNIVSEAAVDRLANSKDVVERDVVSKEIFRSCSIGGPFGSQATGIQFCSDVISASPPISTSSRPIFSDVQEKTNLNCNPSKFQSTGQFFSSKDSSGKSRVSIFSFGKDTQNKGHSRPLPRAGDPKFMPIVQGSNMLAQEGSLPGKFSYSSAQHLHENIRASKYRQMVDTEPEISKQFYNVKDMAQELDTLLLFIEKEGGFKDACTVFQRSSLLALENGLGDLSEMSRICKRKIEVQLLEIQQLQNKMLQVSARQGYMKGLVEQASSKKYWEIWNRQKLNPELEAKRHNILNVNQNLTSEIIELERHFNTLEINRFGESSGTSGHTAFPKVSVPSRQKPSLQSVYNTVNSQIAAAKHLSECLSKQMSELNINSPCVKHKSITKELFESIGLSHEATSSLSPVCKISLTPYSVMRMLPSPVSPIKRYPGKNAASVTKALEPETARRRVSLDRTWATFEPPKTTVKRIMQLQRSRISEDRPFRKAKEAFDLEMEAFAIKQKSNDTHVSSSSQYLLNEGTQDRHSKQVIEAPTNFVPKWAKDISGSSQILVSKSLPVDGMQRTRSLQLISPSVFKSGAQSSLKELCGSPDLSRTEATQAGNLSKPLAAKTVASSTSMFNIRCKYSLVHTSSASSSLVSPMSTGPVAEPLDQESKSLYLTSRGNIPDLPNENGTSSPSTLPAFNGNTTLFSKITTKNQSSESLLNPASHPKTSLPTSCSLPVPFSSSTVAATPVITPLTSASVAHIPFGTSLLSTKAAGIIDPTVSESSSTSATDKQSLLSSNVPSSQLKASLPDKTVGVSTINTKSKELDLASVSTSTFGFSSSEYSVSSSNSQFSQSQTTSSTTFASLSTSLGSPSVTEPIAPTESTVGDSVHLDNISSKSQPAKTTLPTPLEVKSPPKIENNFHQVNGGSTSLVTSVSQPSISSPAVMLSTTTEKDKGLDASLSQEDEMDEEAPDTSTTISLGSLGVFGLGTTSSAPKPNPFGGSFLTATSGAASSPFTFSTSPGEPFRPASFSLPSAAQPVHVTSQQPAVSGGGFGGFGQPKQLGVGQQALGSVLGSFGQSRQIGSGTPSTGFPSGGISPPAAAAGGFAAASACTGGFGSVAGGGFAAAAAKSGGFAALAQGSGGFGAGFLSGGFASFGGNQGGFSGFAGDSTSSTGKPPASFLTQMRK